MRISVVHALRLGFLSLSVLALAGCAVAKRDRYDVPVVPLPEQFKNAPKADPSADLKNKPAKIETKLDPVLVEWWRAFGSPELNALIARGLANNPDVRIATFKIAQAKARADQAIAGKGPTITTPLSASLQFPYYGAQGSSIPGQNRNGPGGKVNKQLFQASIQGDWRVDVWGELDSLAESSNLQLWRASFDRDNAQGIAAANIALSYVEYLSLNDRIRVAHETETVLSGLVSSVEERMKIGDATVIDLEQERTAVFQVRATIPALDQQRDDALGTIAFLMGTVSSSVKLSDSGLDSLALPLVKPGVPSSLVLRRPDVRAVEARLLAADADIDVARARILPPLDLSTKVGYGSFYLSELFKPQALFWNVMATLSATIFDGGKLSKEKEYAQAVHEEMVETYVRTIYQAVREVESSLNAIRQTSLRVDAQKQSADAALRAWNFTSEVYSVGAIDYLTLLDTERTYHRNLDEYYRIRMDRYKSVVNLFHALGGGVPTVEPIPGKGDRPIAPPESKAGVVLDSPNNSLAVEGADWKDSQDYAQEDTWLVELPGLYHRKDIDAAWIDMKTRFPVLMENRFMRRYQSGRMEDSADKRLSWYQLYIGKFDTDKDALKLCTSLWRGHQRCKVVKSKMGEIVPSGKTLRVDNASVMQADSEVAKSPSSGDSANMTPQPLSLVRANEHSGGGAAHQKSNESLTPLNTYSGGMENVGVSWSGQRFWLVEMFDSLDRNAVAVKWRDLRTHFPKQMKNRIILPRRQNGAVDGGNSSTSQYHLFIATFPDQKAAEGFCSTLRTEQQRCRVVLSNSLAENEGVALPANASKRASSLAFPEQNVKVSHP